MNKSYLVLETKVFKNEKVLGDKDVRVYVYDSPFSHELSVFVAEPHIETRIYEAQYQKDEPVSLIPHIGDMLILLSSESVASGLQYIFKGNMYDEFLYVQKDTGNLIYVWVDAGKNLKIEKSVHTEDNNFDRLAFDLSYMLLKEHGLDIFVSESYRFSNILAANDENVEEEKVEIPEPEPVEQPHKVTVEEANEVANQLENLINKDYTEEEKKKEAKE